MAEVDQYTLSVLMQVKDSFTDSFNKAIDNIATKMGSTEKQTTQSTSTMGKALDSLKQNWVGLSVGVNQALEIVGKIEGYAGKVYDFVKAGAQVELVETAFKKMSESVGTDSEELLTRLQKASEGVMSDTDLMSKATEMMLAQVKPDTIVSLTESMKKLAPYAGMTLPEGMDRLSRAVEYGTARSLRSVIGYIDLQHELENYANKLGMTSARLSDFARIQATAEIVQDRMKQKMSGLHGEMNLGISVFSRFEAAWKTMVENMEKGSGPLASVLALVVKLLNTMNNYSKSEAAGQADALHR